MLKTYGFEFLYTRRVNQDSLENFFGSIRQQSGNCVNPTPIQFTRAFRKLLCLNLFYSGTENCEQDSDQILLKITDMPQRKYESETIQTVKWEGDTDYRHMDILQKNFIRYICGYLINKCLKIHSCDICISYANLHSDLDDTSLFCYFKAYNNESHIFGSLKMPDDNFVYFIASLEVVFQKSFNNIIVEDNVLEKLINSCKNIVFKHPCMNFPRDYVITLYGRVRLFYTLKFINRNFKSTPRDRKLIIWRHN